MLCAAEFVEDKDYRIFFEAADKIIPEVSATLLAQSKVIAWAMPQEDILGSAPRFCLAREEVNTAVKATVKAVNAVLG